jgi:hypothetical protein
MLKGKRIWEYFTTGNGIGPFLATMLLFFVPLGLMGVAVIGYQDLQVISTPGNPASGYLRWYATSGGLNCLTSAGASCLPGGAPPASADVLGTNSSSQFVSATAASIYGLFSGTCSSSTYLSGAGTCSTPAGTGTGFTNPMTTEGDIIYGGSGGTATRLGAGTAGYLLATNGTGGAPSWVAPGTQTIASGTASLGTSSIASGACASAVTVSASGVASTDNIQADFNASPIAVTGYIPSASGMLAIIKYPTSGDVNFRVCNNTSASVTPGAITLNWRVTR